MGFKGGLWLFWNRDRVNLTVLDMDTQFIHAQIVCHGKQPWLLASVYRDPNKNNHSFWDAIEGLATSISTPWAVIGDFNAIASSSEGQGGTDSTPFRMGFVDLGYIGSKFTWARGKSQATKIQRRLYRAICNVDKRTDWPEATVQHLPRIQADHAPILMSLMNIYHQNRANRPFRFIAAWMDHPDFSKTVEANWDC